MLQMIVVMRFGEKLLQICDRILKNWPICHIFIVIEKTWTPSCLQSREESKYVNSFSVYFESVFRSNERLFTPVKNAFFRC